MRTRMIVALALVAVGLVWIGQGLGVLKGTSFMVGDLRWAAIGLAMFATGLVLVISAWSRRPPA